jgi:signal transduction histidine kinase
MPDGSLWLGLRSKGVNIIHPERPIKQLPIDLKQPETALPSGAVRAFTLPIQGWVYFATNRGLYRSDIRGDHLQRVNMTQRDPAAAVVAMLQQERRLWLGGVDGLWLIDFAKGEPLQAQRVAGSEPLNKQLIMAVQADKQGRLWIGTRENGLVRFAPESGHLESIRANPSDPKALSSDSIASLLEDPQGRIWIATQGGGINVLSPSLGDHPQRIQRIGTQQGLPNNMVNKLLQDDKQQIWASTDDGLALIDPVSFSIRPLRMADGVPITTYWTNSGVKGLLGEMIFGGSGGITMVLPLRLKQSQNRPPLVVTRLELGGKTINTHPKPQPLLIHPQANRIAVEFSVLDYVSPKDNRYAYRLDGVDTDWNNSNPEQRLASYANLAPGKYLLRLRGSNQQGQWNEEELQIPVRVLPAWHQTWWWYLILVVLTGGGLWGVVHARTSYFRKRQIELKNLVAHRTTQLLQQAKTASLGTLTAGIAHEINNPSNFAHVGAYNLGTQLVEFQNLLTQLAGDDAPQDLRDTLQQHFDKMNVSLATISEGTSRIRDLVKDLRTFSRLDEAQIKSVAIADSLRATVNLVRTQYAGHVAIHCELAANPIIECSPAELNQVFMALIINACQAICARPPEVCALDPGVLVIRSNIEGDSLMFEFEDNGGGVPEAIRERIFDPFFTTKPVGEGMGMGLSISLGIIQKHRGAIKLKAIPGGSCFVVSLPLHEVVH